MTTALITGGAGFIATNLADRLAKDGLDILLLDNLSRPGVEKNLKWLLQTHPDKIQFIRGDIRDSRLVEDLVAQADEVFHLAAQVAVTTSLESPAFDFEVNARGTLNILEALRKDSRKKPLLFTSTNKVLGSLEDLQLIEKDGRYSPISEEVRTFGVTAPRLDFCSPYGCSKGSADQYVLEYARSFGVPAAVFRMSCIYGPHQWGNEDQGWVAHFIYRFLAGETITIYGNGRQVRDLLFVDDLIQAFLLAVAKIDKIAGQAFQIGGGPNQAVSLLEVLEILRMLYPETVMNIDFSEWRVADQRYYVSDIRSFHEATGWSPKIGVEQGIHQLIRWIQSEHREKISADEAQKEIACELLVENA